MAKIYFPVLMIEQKQNGNKTTSQQQQRKENTHTILSINISDIVRNVHIFTHLMNLMIFIIWGCNFTPYSSCWMWIPHCVMNFEEP